MGEKRYSVTVENVTIRYRNLKAYSIKKQLFRKKNNEKQYFEAVKNVSFQIEVIWILLKKKEFTSFFLKISFFQTVFFVAISPLRGYFCKIMWNHRKERKRKIYYFARNSRDFFTG